MCLFDDPALENNDDRLERFFREWTDILAHPPTDSDDWGTDFDERSSAGFVVALGDGSAPAPLREVHEMNRIVALFAGKLSDGTSTHRIGSPIFHHPDFAHLEMEREPQPD